MLYLTETEKGEPKRFILREKRDVLDAIYDNLCIHIPGVSPNKSENGELFFSLPAEELNIYTLKKILPTLKFSPELITFQKQSEAKRRLLLDVKNDEYHYMHKFLWDFQKSDLEFMKFAKSTINANPMGSGKTVEGIALIEDCFKANLAFPERNTNILVIVPNSLKLYWKNEIKRFINKNAIIGKSSTFNKINPIKIDDDNILIINYEMLRNDKFALIFEIVWNLIILDEAHKIKNRRAQQSKGAKKLKSYSKALLTGSPIPNHPSELWSLLNFLYPKRFSSYWQFIERFCVQENVPYSPVPIIVDVKNMPSLKYILDSIMIRRNKDEVLGDLPEKRSKIIELEMEKEQKKLYDEMEKDMVFKLENGESIEAAIPLTKLIRLRQLTLSPAIFGVNCIGVKTQAILDILEDSDEKIVVFSMSKLYIEFLSKLLNERGYQKFVKVTGDLALEERQQAIDNFTNNPDIKLFLATIQTMGEGTNLQIASTLIFADKSWVPTINEQAENRIYRIGQKNKTLIISLICKNTIDKSVEKVLKNKSKVINRIMLLIEIFNDDIRKKYKLRKEGKK